MPVLTNERQALERERAELPAQLAEYQKELDTTTPEDTARLQWQIRRVRKRMAEVEARLRKG
jgi:hypothetical protein